jgi:hypothetical protein
MLGEVALSKLQPNNPDSLVISDVNDALRRTYIQRSLIVVSRALSNVTAIDSSSPVYELPGRNNFLMQIKAKTGTPTGFVVNLQGSLLGTEGVDHNSIDWNTIDTHNGLGFHSVTSPVPYRYYRLILSNACSAGTSIDVHFSAIAY